MVEGFHNPAYLLLSVQRALWGAIPPSLRAVTAEASGTEVRMRFVFDGPVDEDDLDAAQIAGGFGELMSSNAGSSAQRSAWVNGWDAATSGACGKGK